MRGTHTIEVAGIPEELLERLDEAVQRQGGDRASFIRELIWKELQRDPPAPPEEGPLPMRG